jgi:DNA-binding NarL/FixJ family response regulator
MSGLRVVVCDDHRTMREALAGYLALQDAVAAVRTAADSDEALRLVREGTDVLVLDLRLADGESGLELLEAMRNLGIELPVLVLGAPDDVTLVARALALGALGYVPKTTSPETLYRSLVDVAAGKAAIPALALNPVLESLRTEMHREREARALLGRLTTRERDVLTLLSQGVDRVEIARRLHLSGNTVRTHIRHILTKLGVGSQLAAAARGRELLEAASRRLPTQPRHDSHVIDLRDNAIGNHSPF